MMSSLDTIAKESDETGDDKEQLNANIMYIGMFFFLFFFLFNDILFFI